MTMKKISRVVFEHYNTFECGEEEFTEHIRAAKQQLVDDGVDPDKIRLVFEAYEEYGSTEIRITLSGVRPMTAKELALAQQFEAEQRARLEASRRAEYEALKKEFGP